MPLNVPVEDIHLIVQLPVLFNACIKLGVGIDVFHYLVPHLQRIPTEDVLGCFRMFLAHPESSVRDISKICSYSKSTVWNILHTYSAYPYRPVLAQELMPGDQERRFDFCNFVLNTLDENLDFFNEVLWADECPFSSGVTYPPQPLHCGWGGQDSRRSKAYVMLWFCNCLLRLLSPALVTLAEKGKRKTFSSVVAPSTRNKSSQSRQTHLTHQPKSPDPLHAETKVVTHLTNIAGHKFTMGSIYHQRVLRSADHHVIISDELRTIAAYLDEKREEIYVIQLLDSRPQKIVIKGLPVSTEIGEIQADLTSQGFCVEKVAQLTGSKTKSPLPVFMVDLKRSSDSPDIFKVKKCCYLATRSPNGRRVARPMGRVPLPPQIEFLPCTSQSQDKSKARLPIGRENLGHWSIESL
ncbi:uncharacterized protein TNCV_194721 [Trichonephila clavipes]|nr:uncharacterized protein TNCV_194721 [Trichonephila clavipes]